MVCDPAVQTNQVVRRVDNLNLAHSPEVVVARRGLLQKRLLTSDYGLDSILIKYQCLRLEGDVYWVGSGPRWKGDVELQGNRFSGINISVAPVHRFYRCLTVARLPVLRKETLCNLGIVSDKNTGSEVKSQF